jgi:hypothetical protein
MPYSFRFVSLSEGTKNSPLEEETKRVPMEVVGEVRTSMEREWGEEDTMV